MRQLTSIVAVNEDGVIGCRNSLPWRVKSDMAFFRATTTNNVVVMGRKTYDSLGRCLPNRYNVVLSNNFGLFADGQSCVLRTGLPEGLAEAEAAPPSFAEIFAIGGATMYEQFNALVDRYLITVVNKKVSDGDAFFDMGVFERSDLWTVKRMAAGTRGEGDEALFEIYELIAKDGERRAEVRKAMVKAHMGRRHASSIERRRSAGHKEAMPAFDW